MNYTKDLTYYTKKENYNKKNLFLFKIYLKKIDNVYNNFLNKKNFSQKEVNKNFKIINNYSYKIFNFLKKCSINKSKDYEIFIDEIKTLYIQYLGELKNYYCSTKVIFSTNYNAQLFCKGYFFDKLHDKDINKILTISNKSIQYFKKNIKKKLLSREDLSINTGNKIRKIIKILNNKFKEKGILDEVSQYMQKNYKVIGCSLELSAPNSSWWKNEQKNNSTIINSNQTWYAHVDQSKIFPKAILYLTDVTNLNGPTSFYPNALQKLKLNFFTDCVGKIIDSVADNNVYLKKIYKPINGKLMNCKTFKSHFEKLPNSIKFNSHFGWYVKKNTKLEKMLVKNEIKMLGKKGTFVVFDGARILHRGGLIKKKTRLVLQIVFGPNKNIIEKIILKILREFKDYVKIFKQKFFFKYST
jgi:hypothetical protein